MTMVVGGIFLSKPVHAEPAHADMRVTVPVIVGMGALWLGSEFAKGSLAPRECRWCEPGGLDASVTRSLWAGGGAHARVAAPATDVLAFGVVPALMLGSTLMHDARIPERGYTDAAVVLESGVAAALLNQATKFLVGRERPFVHALSAADKQNTSSPNDNNLSFYSGHTSFTFALAASATTVAAMRDSKLTPWIAGVGGGLALATGVGRIVAGKHYASDVAVGAITGTLMGVAVPLLFHRGERTSLQPTLSMSGGALSYGGAW